MFSMLKTIKPLELKGYYNNFICLTLRQWAILFSILIFIVMAIITTCTVLATLHTKQVLHILEDDIEEERYKHHNYDEDDHKAISKNEIRLQHGQEYVLTFSKILSIAMWLSWMNLVLTAVLIYGVTTMITIYILPWIFISAITYLLAITVEIMGYFNFIYGIYISYPLIWVCLAASMIFIEMWYTIVLYYLNLRRTKCPRNGSSPTVIHAYGGYTHTIEPLRKNVNKPLV